MIHHTFTPESRAVVSPLPESNVTSSLGWHASFTYVATFLLALLGMTSINASAQDTAITCASRWVHVGNPGFNAGAPTSYPSTAFNSAGVPHVVYRDGGNGGKLTVSKYVGTGVTGWAPVGSAGFGSTGTVNFSNIAISSADSLWVAYKDESTNKAVVRKFDGTNWNQVGASLSVGTADYISLDLDESDVPYVAYRDAFNGKLSVKKLAGDTWVDVGATYVTASSIHATARITIDVDGGIPYVAYRETNGKLSVIKYSSSAWSSLGGVFTDSTEYPALAVKFGIPYVIYRDIPLSLKATVKKFDGTTWVTVGTEGFTEAGAIWTDITVNSLGQPVVLYGSDSSASKKNNAMVFDGTSWNNIANPNFSGGNSAYNQIHVDASGNYWVSYSDNLYSTRISVLKVTTAVLQPTTGPDFACTGGSATFVNTTSGGSWSSSNASVGTIGSTTGILATSAFSGTTTISYTVYTGCSRTKLVSVNTTPGTVSGGAAAFCVNATTTLSVTGGGVWTSSNPEIATVGSSSGIVTGVSGGTATITLTNSGGCTKTKVVTINALPAVSDITGNLTVSTSRITSQLSVTPTGGTWSSGTIGVGTVSTTGIVTGGTTAGTTVISYRVSATGCTNTVTAVVTNKTAVVGLNLDGSNDYISLPEGVSSATDFTFEAWVNPTSNVNDARLFDFGTSATSDMYFTTRDATSTFPKFAITSGGETQSVSATAALPLSTWSHLAVTLGGGIAKMYVNGALVATNSAFTFTPSTIGTTAVNSIGRSIASGNYFAGSIDEVRFWNAARSVDEIQAAKNCDIDPTTGLLISYRFNNGTAASSNTSNTTAVDYSGNNKCGTLNSFALTGTTSNYVTGALGLCNTVTSPVFSVNPVAAVCAGQNTTLTTTGTGGTWSSSNTTVGTINTSTGIFTGLTAGTASVSYTVISNCIPTSFSTIVTVNAQPTTFTGTLSACEGNTSALGSTPVSGSWTSSAPSVATIGTSGIVSGVLAGTTTISYIHPTTGCVRTAEFTVNPLPSAITGTTNTDIAATTTLTSTPAGSWSSTSDAVATVNSATGVVTGIASGTTTISYTTAAGCARTTAFTVNLAAISGSSSTCIGVPVTLTHPLSGGTWVSGTPAVATVGSSSGIVTGISTGTSVITYNAIGLSRTFVITVLGTAPVISGTTTLCATSATTLSATPTSGEWSSSNLTVASVNATNGIVTGNTSGTAVITYTLGSCFSTTTVSVTAPLAAIGGNNTVCIGGAIALTHTTGSGTWSSSSPSNATVNSATGLVSAVVAGNTTITYALSSSCYATKAVTVAPAPVAITGVASVCQGSTTTLSHTTGGGTWISGTTSIATVDASGVVNGVASGTSVISYFTSEGCFATRIVTVIALPSAIGGTATVCEGATTTLTGSGSGTWFSANTDVATIGNTSGIVSGLSAGTSNITFTLTSTGCSTSRTVTVNALPSVIGGSLSVCASATTTLTSTPAAGSWASSSTGIATIDEATGVTTGVAAGTSVVSYTSVAGCRRTAVVTVNSLPSFITGTPSLCVGSTSTLGSITSSQTWSSSNPSVATVATASVTTGLVTGVANGTAVISYTNGTGCSRTLTVTVSAAPASITGDDIVCNGGTVALSTTSTGGTWSSGNAARATVNSLSGSVTGVTAGVVVITYSLGSTCYVIKQMTVNSAPAAISGVGSVCIGSTLSLSHAVPSGTWSTPSSNISIGATTGVVTGISWYRRSYLLHIRWLLCNSSCNR